MLVIRLRDSSTGRTPTDSFSRVTMAEGGPPPNLMNDFAAMGVSPLLIAATAAAVVITLALYGLFAKPRGVARLTYFEGHGRAEEVRLMLAACGVQWKEAVYGDDSGAQYVTTAAQMRALMSHGALAMEQLPLLQLDGLCLVQQPAILRYLARRHNLYGGSMAEAAQIDILSDSIGDWAPISALLQEKESGALHAKYLSRFDRALASNREGDFLVGRRLSFVDIQLFQALEQLADAKAVDLRAKWPALDAYRSRLRKLGPIAAYLASPSRTPFYGAGGRAAFFETVERVLPWVFGKAKQPALLSKEWRFRQGGAAN